MNVQSVKRLLRLFWLLVLTSTPLLATLAAAATCATPGKDGVGTLSGVINSYYAGSGTASGTSLTLGAKSAGSAAANITAGDLILIMQMQDGSATDFGTAATYGSGTGSAGLYEYASVRSIVGSVVTLASALTNTYTQSFGTRQTFQVVRVPQYSSATVTGVVKAQTWTIDTSGNATGGILALDVAGALVLNANLDVSGQGFRGGGAANVTGNRTGGTFSDLRYAQSTNNGASKGEGTAGTPASVFNGTATFSTYTSNYTNGDNGRGSPGNAGGGANDGQPDGGGNQYNAGGGGGGNAGAGGGGGLSWSLQNAAGGLGGKATVPGTTRLFLGGGGGAGGSNNNAEAVAVTTYPPTAAGGGATGPITISGASGGGIVMVRSGTLSGSGQINADGYRAYNTSGGSEAAGAGGAGGSVLLTVNSGAGSPVISARGGAGGNSNYYHHGPGGGGGGGYVVTSTNLSPTITKTGGAPGFDATSGAPNGYAVNADGAVAGTDGTAATVAPPASTLCFPVLTVAKSTSTPLRTNGTDTTATYTVTVSNSAATSGGVVGASVSDALPSPFTYNGAAITPAYMGGASGPASVIGSGTTNAVFGTAGDSANGFFIPQGGSVALSFTVNLGAASTGTYQNPASVSFSDPTRTAAATVVSPGGTYTGGGTVGGSNYASASSTAEDVTINNPPTTSNVTNVVLLDTAAATVLSPNLSAADTDGTVASYTIVTIPAAASGVLSVNGAPVLAGQSFTAAQLATLSFDPAAGFAGNATFTYKATDNLGAASNTSTYTIPVNVLPVAVNDTSSTPANTAKTFSVTGNDTDTAPGTVNVTSTVFATTGQPAGAVLTNGNRTITVPGEGSYTLDNAGNVTFAPVSGYSGTTTAVKYTVSDNQGAVSNVASITVAVTPVATNDTAATAPSTLVNIPVLTNDVGAGKVLTSLLFPASGQPVGSTVSNAGKTLTNADGVYNIRTDGTVDFTPVLGKTGALAGVLYTFVDAAGQTSNPASVTVTVSAIAAPTATNDSKTTPKNTPVTLEGSTNDTAGSLPIDQASVVFPVAGQPGTATVSNAGKTLTVTGQGTYQVQTNGTVIFTPVGTFAGTATPVYYTVKDTSGATSNPASLSVTVTNQPPVASTVTNTLLTSTAPATLLSPGVSGTDPDGTVVTYTVTTLPTAAMGTLYCGGTAIASVPSTCAPAQLSFQPNPAFNGNATFQYTVTDDNGAASAAATYTIPVNKPPVANNDSAATNPNVSVTFSVTGNDTDTAPGTVTVGGVVFDPSSTGTIGSAGKTLTVTNVGVYTANADGTVTFVPAAGFNNGVSTARYTVTDNNGAVSNVATISVTVPASVDLGITKIGPAYFKPGDALNYTLTVTNTGSAATGTTVTDTLPSGLTFVSASSGGTYNSGTGKVSWTLGNVATGASVTLTVSGTAPVATSIEASNGPVSLTNSAVTAANESEVVNTNNMASTTAQLVYPKLSKRVRNVTQSGVFGTAGTGKPNEVLEYCIDFRNYGVAVAGFVISDIVPANTNADLSAYGAGLGLQVVRGGTTTRTSASTDADGGSLSASALSLDLGSLAAGESGSVCFRASIK